MDDRKGDIQRRIRITEDTFPNLKKSINKQNNFDRNKGETNPYPSPPMWQ